MAAVLQEANATMDDGGKDADDKDVSDNRAAEEGSPDGSPDGKGNDAAAGAAVEGSAMDASEEGAAGDGGGGGGAEGKGKFLFDEDDLDDESDDDEVTLDGLFLGTCLEPPLNEDPTDRAIEQIRAGADPKTISTLGETAVHLLVKGITCCDDCGLQIWRREMAQMLVETDGVDPNHENKEGRTARDIAVERDYKDFSRELQILEKEFKKKKEREGALRFRV